MRDPDLFNAAAREARAAGTVADRLRLGEPLAVLTLWQPWASLIVAGLKRFETRSWPTRYRGLVAIHAAKTTVGLSARVHGSTLLRLVLQAEPGGLDALPLGAILGIVELDDCRPTGRNAEAPPPPWLQLLDEEELAAGNFDPHRWAWRVFPLAKLSRPIPHRGGRKLIAAPNSLKLQLAELVQPLAGATPFCSPGRKP